VRYHYIITGIDFPLASGDLLFVRLPNGTKLRYRASCVECGKNVRRGDLNLVASRPPTRRAPTWSRSDQMILAR
jgi:hypothetical protein